MATAKRNAAQDMPHSFFFDHTYIKSFTGEEYLSLGERGFILDPSEMEHPGSQHCRFIKFGLKNPSEAQKFHYLEFVHLKDFEHHRKVKETDAGEPLTDANLLMPGLSLGCAHGLKEIFESRRDELASFEPTFTHKNYEWKKDAVTMLPGWNFMSFKKTLFPGIYIWITEYETGIDRAKKMESPTLPHPNTATLILGTLWNRPEKRNNEKEMAIPFSRILGSQASSKAGPAQDHIDLNGTKVHLVSKTEDPALSKCFETKTTPYFAVILECESLAEFSKVAKPDYETSWLGRPALGIRHQPHMWDLLVVQAQT